MRQRTAGIVLHPTSLPGRFGIGDLGDEAFHFVDFLVEARQGLWQVLPLGPTGYGDSPYQCFSAFAGNPNLVSPERLVRDGLLTKRDLAHVPHFPADRVDFGPVIDSKKALLIQAYRQFRAGNTGELVAPFAQFCAENASWLDVYAVFQALKDARDGARWDTWEPDLAACNVDAVARAAQTLGDRVDAIKFAQFLFFRQWFELKAYANANGVRILGDAPIFVAFDSADVWANRPLFKMDAAGQPTVVAGVPPDYFSKTGQLWGNPLYDWDRMRETNYVWWIERIRASLGLFDLVRLDHFRGFAACWEVPATDETAIGGTWVDVPGQEMFDACFAALGNLSIVAEDLGVITPDVDALRNRYGFPGMHVLQFAFSTDGTNTHLPHNYVPNSVCYTGTHDNDTTVGWFRAHKTGASGKERAYLRRYLNTYGVDISWDFIRAAYASVSDIAIAPMQDILGLGTDARMNRPSSASGNWDWRLPPRSLGTSLRRRLARLAEDTGRAASSTEDVAEPSVTPSS